MAATATIDIEVNSNQAIQDLEAFEHKTEQLDANIKTFQGSIDLVGGSVEALVGGLALLGVESEWIENMEQGVLGAIAFADGTKRMSDGILALREGLVKSAAAQRIFNAVAKANPYVLVASVLLTAAAALGAYTFLTDEDTDATEENKEAKEDLIDAETRLKELRDEASGRITEIADLDSKNRKIAIDDIKQQIGTNETLITSLEQQRSNLLATTKGYVFMTDQQKLQYDQAGLNISQMKAENIVNKELIDGVEKLVKKRKDEKDAADAAKKATDDAAKAAKKAAQDAADAAIIQANTDFMNRLIEVQTLLADIRRGGMEDEQVFLEDLENSYTEQLSLLDAFYFEGLMSDEAYYEAKLQAEQNYIEAKAEIEKTANEATEAREQELADTVADAHTYLMNAKFDAAQTGIQLLASLAPQAEDTQKAFFAVEKAVAIGQILVNAAKEKAANAAYASTLGPAGPAYLIPANAATNFRTATNIASVVAATIARFKSGGAQPPGDNTPAVTPGLSFNDIASRTAQQPNTNNQGGPNATVRAYVVSGDVQNGLEADRQLIRRRVL